MFRFSHKESYEYELPGTWLFRMIDFYITNVKMCSGRWTSILTSLRTYTIEAACHAVSQVLHSREYEWSWKSTVVEADPRESWSQTLRDVRQTLPALKVIYDYCSLVNEHDFSVGLYFMFVQMFLSWVSDGSCWNIRFSWSSREWLVSCWDWRFFFKQSACFAKLFHEFCLCTSCVPYLAWRIACTGQQATRTIPLVHTSLTSHVLMLVVQLMGF
jgi:hypothetical protein